MVMELSSNPPLHPESAWVGEGEGVRGGIYPLLSHPLDRCTIVPPPSVSLLVGYIVNRVCSAYGLSRV